MVAVFTAGGVQPLAGRQHLKSAGPGHRPVGFVSPEIFKGYERSLTGSCVAARARTCEATGATTPTSLGATLDVSRVIGTEASVLYSSTRRACTGSDADTGRTASSARAVECSLCSCDREQSSIETKHGGRELGGRNVCRAYLSFDEILRSYKATDGYEVEAIECGAGRLSNKWQRISQAHLGTIWSWTCTRWHSL